MEYLKSLYDKHKKYLDLIFFISIGLGLFHGIYGWATEMIQLFHAGDIVWGFIGIIFATLIVVLYVIVDVIVLFPVILIISILPYLIFRGLVK